MQPGGGQSQSGFESAVTQADQAITKCMHFDEAQTFADAFDRIAASLREITSSMRQLQTSQQQGFALPPQGGGQPVNPHAPPPIDNGEFAQNFPALSPQTLR